MPENSKLKILLGGIPLGCDNVGDEAILSSVVALIRKNNPSAEITVCTADLETTAKNLQVKCAPLYGFNPALKLSGFAQLVAQNDCFCWCGATGLSDYPAQALRLLEIARKKNVPTLVWGVGMDSTFNPAFFTIQGRKKQLLTLASRLGLNLIDFVRLGERFLVWSIRRKIRRGLSGCSLVVLRNPESLIEVEKCGFRKAVVGADSAILLPSAPVSQIERKAGQIKIGFCISAQRKVAKSAKITELWQRLLDKGFRLVMIPMNPQTDRALMKELSRGLDQAEIEWVSSAEPEQVQAAAGQCDVLVSSRLHLLILGANELIPIVGIERGSKIANFLADFGLASVGTVDNCDFAKIEKEIDRFMTDGGEGFRRIAQAVHDKLLNRLATAEALLASKLNEISRRK